MRAKVFVQSGENAVQVDIVLRQVLVLLHAMKPPSANMAKMVEITIGDVEVLLDVFLGRAP